MDRLGIEEDTPIEHKIISNAIERAQKKVEEYHFGMRKQVLEFDDVMNRQRETIYGLRRRILEGKNLKEKLFEMMEQASEDLVNAYLAEKIHPDEWDYDGLIKAISEIIPIQGLEAIKEMKDRQEIKSSLRRPRATVVVVCMHQLKRLERDALPEQLGKGSSHNSGYPL